MGTHGSAWVSAPLERVPVDVSYVERRWHRLLMIALALLPAYSLLRVNLLSDGGKNGDGDGTSDSGSIAFMVVTVTLSYMIKLFYFDLVDGNEAANVLRASRIGMGSNRRQVASSE